MGVVGVGGAGAVAQVEAAAELEAEIRRLRLRISGFTTAQLDELVGESGTEPGVGMIPRRVRVRGALAQLAALDSRNHPGRASLTVPDLGDRVLADQVVVLLSEFLPVNGAGAAQTQAALEIARSLRQDL